MYCKWTKKKYAFLPKLGNEQNVHVNVVKMGDALRAAH